MPVPFRKLTFPEGHVVSMPVACAEICVCTAKRVAGYRRKTSSDLGRTSGQPRSYGWLTWVVRVVAPGRSIFFIAGKGIFRTKERKFLRHTAENRTGAALFFAGRFRIFRKASRSRFRLLPDDSSLLPDTPSYGAAAFLTCCRFLPAVARSSTTRGRLGRRTLFY